MVNFMQKIFRRGKKTKTSHLHAASSKNKKDDESIQNAKQDFTQKVHESMHDPNGEDHEGECKHPQDSIEKNQEILNDLLQKKLFDLAFTNNVDGCHEGDMEELSKLPKSSSQHQRKNPHLELEENKELLPSKRNGNNTMQTKIMFDRPWIVKMRTNDDGFPTLECFAIDDDGDIMQVNGHPVPPLHNDPPKNEWKPVNQTLKLCETVPVPTCPKHKNAQEPPQFELVRETTLQATIFNRYVNVE